MTGSATGAPTPTEPIVLHRFDDVRDAYRRKELRQALYDDGAIVMADCLLTLHGDAHRARRRLENRLFRREMFQQWERNVLGPTVTHALAPFVTAGTGDLLPIGYRTTMALTALIAGVDHADDPGTTDSLYELVKVFSIGATLVHTTRPRHEVVAEVQAAIDQFDCAFLQPSISRRRGLLRDVETGARLEDALPKDVLTTLLRNEDALALPADVVRREICFYLQAGSHSTANAFTHTMHQLFGWFDDHPSDEYRLRRACETGTIGTADRLFLQRCVHESLRLVPASPVAWRRPDTTTALPSGCRLPADALVVLDLMAANRDPHVFGPTAHQFDPNRDVPDGVARWGHAFGGGTHACIGRELDGGADPDDVTNADDHLYGTIEVMIETLLATGAHPDPSAPPVLDPSSSRPHFSSYPVRFQRTDSSVG